MSKAAEAAISNFVWTEKSHGDEYILNERSYDCLFTEPDSLNPDDRWMDIGAHVGYFSVRMSQFVHSIIAVEPHPLNLRHLKENIELNSVKNITVVEGAAIADASQEVDLGVGRTFTYTHMVRKVRGREHIKVAGINIQELLDTYRPNKIKMDCEGMEYSLLSTMSYTGILEIILEWHFTLIPDSDWTKLIEFLQKLRDEGFTILRGPRNLHEPTKRWTAIIWAKR